MNEISPFRRMVLSLQPSAPSRMFAFAGEVAKALQLDLIGMFNEDPNLRRFAGLPFAREFRTIDGGWHELEPGRIIEEIDIAMRAARRSFETIAQKLALAGEFAIASATPAEALSAMLRAGDIVVIAEPPHPAERVGAQFLQLLEAAHRSCASVLIVPRKVQLREGPIAVLAAEAEAACMSAAKTLARALHSPLRQIAPPTNTAEYCRPLSIERLFGPIQERLVVVDRRALRDIDTIAIAEWRRVPVLVVEP